MPTASVQAPGNTACSPPHTPALPHCRPPTQRPAPLLPAWTPLRSQLSGVLQHPKRLARAFLQLVVVSNAAGHERPGGKTFVGGRVGFRVHTCQRGGGRRTGGPRVGHSTQKGGKSSAASAGKSPAGSRRQAKQERAETEAKVLCREAGKRAAMPSQAAARAAQGARPGSACGCAWGYRHKGACW